MVTLLCAAWLPVPTASRVAPPASAQTQSTDPMDCEGPVPDASPGTPEWDSRDQNNVFCAGQRHLDQTMHPLSGAPFSPPSRVGAPSTRLDSIPTDH